MLWTSSCVSSRPARLLWRQHLQCGQHRLVTLEKPFVLFKAVTQDFCWTVRWMAGLETVYQAYKDKVDFYFITGGGDGGVSL